MKKLMPWIFAGAVGATGLLIGLGASADKDDAETITTVVETLNADDLNPIDHGGGGSTVPDLTVEKVQEIIDHLREVEKHNGHLGIARALGVSTQQVKAVAKAVEKRLRDLAPEPIE